MANLIGTKALARWLLLAVLFLPAQAALAEPLLRWLAPADLDLAGYKVYVDAGSGFDSGYDIGSVPADAAGVAAYDLARLLNDGSYQVAMSAYDRANNESELSNAIAVDVQLDPECATDRDCSDGNLCNGSERCATGLCEAGPPPVCSAARACHRATCDPQLGCRELPVADGTRCDDANASTRNDLCGTGVCSGVQCTADAECADTNRCNGNESCVSGGCRAGSALSCPAPSPCQMGRCDALLGCGAVALADGSACDDRDARTARDTCRTGQCVGELQAPDACASVFGEPRAIHFALASSTMLEVRWRAPLRRTGLPFRYRSADRWREVTALPNTSNQCDAEYRAVLRGLGNLASYQYSVGGPGPSGTLWSPIDTLLTPPDAFGFRQAAAFFGSAPTDAATYRALALGVRMRVPRLVLGDGGAVVTSGSGAGSAGANPAPSAASLFLGLAPFFPTVNYRGSLGFAAAAPTLPSVPRGTYSLDMGHTHYLAIGAGSGSALDPATAQGRAHLDLVERDLVAAVALGRRWIVVYLQLDLFSSFDKGVDPVLATVRAALTAMFERHGVDVVLSSGGPGYERSFPMAGGVAQKQGGTKLLAGQGVIYVRAAAAPPAAGTAFPPTTPDWSARRSLAPAFVLVRDLGPSGFIISGISYDLQRTTTIESVFVRAP